MFSTTADRQLVAGSSTGSLQGQCGQFRPLLPGQHVHAGRRHKRLGSIAAAPFSTPSALGSGPAGVFEEDIEAIAVLERPGAVPSTLFQQHDQAMQQLAELQAFNSELSSAIADADLVLEKAEWNTLVLPPIIKNKWTSTYREGRKKEERQSKEARRKRAELREQQRAERAQQAQQASAATLEQPAAAAPFEQQQQPSPAQHRQQPMPDSIPAAAAPPSSSSSEATAPRQSARAAPQPAVPLQQQQQQAPVPRARRSRSSAVAPAGIPRSVMNSLSALPGSSSSSSDTRQAAAALSAVFEQSAPSQPSTQSAAPAAAAAAAPVAPTPGRAGSRARAARPAAAAANSSISSTSTELAVSSTPAPEQPAAASNSFAPLSVLQARPLGAAAATGRRVQRAAGIRRRGGSSSSTSAGATAALAGAPSWSAKSLADNTIHGLDMRAELLTGEQEKELAVMVQDLLALEGVARELAVKLGRTPTDLEWMDAAEAHGDSPDQQAALAGFHARLHAGRNAKQVMIKANYKLVVSICRKYQGAGMNMGDLINEGISGLVKGVERFEPAKGFKFSTYAHWWIRQAVSRSLADQGRLVRLPIHMQELLSKASKASKAFEAKHGREPTPEELAPELGVEASRIRDAWDAVSAPRSLDQPMGADADGGTLGDVVEDDRTIGSEEAVYIESLKKDLEGVLAGLSERDAGVLRMRFGLLDGREYTLDEVGAEFKVTRERIRQIEAKAIRELRAHHVNPGSVMADYQHGPMADKQLASRTSSGTKKQK